MNLVLPSVSLLFAATVFAPAPLPAASDILKPAAPGTVQLEGWLGQKLDLCLTHRVMAQDIGRLIQPFRDRTEENSGHWRCEYWGKWFTCAFRRGAGRRRSPSTARPRRVAPEVTPP